MNVMMIGSGYDGCNYPRIYLPCIHNGWWTDRPNRREPRLDIKEIKAMLDKSDIVVFHRAEEQTYHNLAKMLKVDGKKIVMDNDDTFKIGDAHPLANFTPDANFKKNLQRREDNINAFIGLADLVTTTTITLAGEYRQLNPNTIILPNYIDPFDWDEPLRNEGRVRIGLVGSTAIEYDYFHIKPLLKELSDREDVELVMFGLGDKKHRKDNPKVTEIFKEEYAFWDSLNIEQIPWCPTYEYPTKLNEARLDFMLIPRRDNYFNRCKSNIKFLEASMCEIPVIAQSFTDSPYEEILPDMGILIKNNDDWGKETERLINDKKLRRSMGAKAREYVLANYDINEHYQEWAEAYQQICAK